MKKPTMKQDPGSGEYFLMIPTHTKSKAEALRFVSQANRDERTVTIAHAIDQWSDWSESVGNSAFTTKNLSEQMREWARRMKLAGLSAAEIGEKQIHAWVNDPERDLKLASRQVKLAAARSLFRFCAAKGWCQGNPSQLVRVNFSMLSHKQKEKRPRQIFEDSEIVALLAEVDRREREYQFADAGFWRAAIPIGRWTGLRLGDLCQLDWACLEKPGFLSTWTEKRDKRVELPIQPQALADAIASVPRNNKQYLFPVQRILTRDPARRAQLSMQFSRIAAGAGIKGKVFHDLRSSYASTCLRDGVPMPHISQSLGHSHEATTRGYIV